MSVSTRAEAVTPGQQALRIARERRTILAKVSESQTYPPDFEVIDKETFEAWANKQRDRYPNTYQDDSWFPFTLYFAHLSAGKIVISEYNQGTTLGRTVAPALSRENAIRWVQLLLYCKKEIIVKLDYATAKTEKGVYESIARSDKGLEYQMEQTGRRLICVAGLRKDGQTCDEIRYVDLDSGLPVIPED